MEFRLVRDTLKLIIEGCLYDYMHTEDGVDIREFISEWVDKNIDPVSKEEHEKESNANTL